MTNFYTNVINLGNKIFYRGYSNGERIKKVVDYSPTLFTTTNQETNYKTLDGKHAMPMYFHDISEARDFVKRYDEVDNFDFYGNTNYQYCYIADNFKGNIDYNINDLVICNFDIEVGSDSGFPDPKNASEPIIAIAMKVKGNFYVFGCGDYENDNDNVYYFKCQSEPHLLEKFLTKWNEVSPDIITGWNIQFFDIPYLVHRITKVLSEDDAKRLSPWRKLSKRNVQIFNKTEVVYKLVGTESLDYLEMYRKYSPNAENYRLDTIAHLELGEKKLDYSEHGSLHNLYKQDYQKFIDYNIKDVDLVDRIDEKLQYISMVISVAYDAKVNYTDVFTQVRMWDTIIFNFLKSKNIVIPQKRKNIKMKYPGGYVKEPPEGQRKWVVSFDLNSLYPNLIAQYNISTETLRPELFTELEECDILDKKKDLTFLKEHNATIAGNGHCFSRDRQGFFPEILMRMYEDRKLYKSKMLEAKKQLELVNKEIIKRGL